MKRGLVLAVLLIAAIGGARPRAAQPPPAGLPAEVDRIAHAGARRDRRAERVGRGRRDGKLATRTRTATRGSIRSSPATPAMRYSIGSISKQFTAAAMLLLQEEGKLSLDDPVGEVRARA